MMFDVGKGDEAVYSELPALEQLVKMGYEYKSKTDLNKERKRTTEVLLYKRLEEAIRRLNPKLDDDGVHDGGSGDGTDGYIKMGATLPDMTSNAGFYADGVGNVMIGDAELVSLRSREIISRPLIDEALGKENTSLRTKWKWINIFLPSLLVIGYGLIRRRNINKKSKYILDYYG